VRIGSFTLSLGPTTGAELIAPPVAAGRSRRGSTVLWLGALVAILIVLPPLLSSANQSLCAAAALAGVAILGVNLIVGSAGQVSLAGAALMAAGGFSANVFANNWSLPFPVPLLCSGLFAALVGTALTLPALRLRGIYLALATLAFYFIVMDLAYLYQNHSVGEFGFSFSPPTLAGYRLDTSLSWYYVNGAVAAILGVGIWNLMRSKYGRAWQAIRAATSAGEAAGVNVAAYKAIAFAVSSFCLGVAGALYAYNYQQVTTGSFPFTLSADQLAMVLIGGLGSMSGSLVGAVVLTLLPTGIQSAVNALPSDFALTSVLGTRVYELTGIIEGLIIVLLVLKAPGGLAEIGRTTVRWLQRWRSRPRQRVEVAGDD
jgi:branched-chain amino acid transport system permease protein